VRTHFISFGGWKNNLCLSNEDTELVVSLDVGPRILSYRTKKGPNVLKIYEEQLGQANEDAWMVRGGHRLWIAPEDEEATYHRDNEPVEHDSGPDGQVTITSRQTEPIRARKEVTLQLAESGSEVTIHHKVTNEGDKPLTAASWGLTVMPPGGRALIPQPPLGQHPRDLLPNRRIVVWPYTDLTDDRWYFGQRFIMLNHDDERGPTKIGLSHTENWVAYIIDDSIFFKTIEYLDPETYPDGGCNFETFANQEMLELESLGPLRSLAPGEASQHTEKWYLVQGFEKVLLEGEDALRDWLDQLRKDAGMKH